MTRRFYLIALMVSSLFGCEKQPERASEDPSNPARAAALESAEMGDRSAPEDAPIADRSWPLKSEVDTRSFWEIEEERERKAILLATSLPKTTCEEDPSAAYFFTLMGRNSVDNCGRLDPRVVAAFGELLADAREAENPDSAIPPFRHSAFKLSSPQWPKCTGSALFSRW